MDSMLMILALVLFWCVIITMLVAKQAPVSALAITPESKNSGVLFWPYPKLRSGLKLYLIYAILAPMQFIDSHAHLNSTEFKDDWKNVVTTAKNAGLTAIVNIAGDRHDSEWGVQQADQEPIVYATVGEHPESLRGRAAGTDELINNLRRLISNSQKVVGIGELGLDYTLDPDLAPKQAQIDLITPQLQLAQELHLPVVLHVRDQPGHTECFDDLIHLLQQFTTPSNQQHPKIVSKSHNLQSTAHSLTGIFHCWTGSPAQLELALNLPDFYISFSGILTYKSAGHILDAAKLVPRDRLLVETDAPYLMPEPRRSSMRKDKSQFQLCQPADVIMTAQKLADARGQSLEEIARITSTNAKKVFHLPASTEI